MRKFLRLSACAGLLCAALPVFAAAERAPSSPPARSPSDEPDSVPPVPPPLVQPPSITLPPNRFIFKDKNFEPRRFSDHRSVFAGNLTVPAGEMVRGNAVVVAGNAVIDGRVGRDATAVAGNLTVNGLVARNATAIAGNVTVNGMVRGDVIAIAGNVRIASGAVVGGRIVCLAGTVQSDPGARVLERNPGSGWNPALPDGSAPWPGAFHPGSWSRFALLGAGLCVALHVLIALLFPRAVRRCGDRFTRRPGLAVLGAVLAILCLPMLLALLAITIIGIPVALLLVLGVVAAVVFGKTSFYALMGRSIGGDRLHPALAVLLGDALFLAAGAMLCLLAPSACAPLLCACVLLGWAGFTFAVAALLPEPVPAGVGGAPGSFPAPGSAPSAAAAPEPFPAPAAEPPPAPPLTALPSSAAGAFAPPPPSVAAPPPLVLPRAGFWPRIGALFIDVLLISFGFGWMHRALVPFPFFTFGFNPLVLPLAAYAALMWKFKGTTIGGIVLGLRVVRLDGQPVGWETAIVRALGCLLSAAPAGLGFFWIAFDDERQGWHDKIAGTAVVRGKPTPLI